MENKKSSDNKHVIAILSTNKIAYSETFIKAHAEKLPAVTKLLHGGWLPLYKDNDEPFLPITKFFKLKCYLRGLFAKRLFNSPLPPDFFHREEISKYLVINKVDAVLAEYGPAGVEIMDICEKLSIPLIVIFHNPGLGANNYQSLNKSNKSYKVLFNKARALIAVSKSIEEILLSSGAMKEKVFYNPCGADTSLFSEGTAGKSPPVFISAGRFADIKAPHLTLLAFKKVVDEIPEAKLLMFGEGALWEACKQMVNALKFSDNVTFFGSKPHKEIADEMKKARAFIQHSVMTSKGEGEGTPVAILEAGAAGIPVISTRHEGIKDVVIHGETGFLVEERDIDGMADYIIKLIKEPEVAEIMGKKAQKHIRENHSMEKSINKLWNIIKKCIEENKQV